MNQPHNLLDDMTDGGRRKPRRARLVIVVASLVVAGLAVYTWRHTSPAAPSYPVSRVADLTLPHRLRSGAEHDEARRRNGGEPYVLHFEPAASGALLYYGASHTRDPGHPQVADITGRWQAFRPTVALYEGRRDRYFYGALIEPFAGLPEPDLVHKLARRDKVELFSLEPTYEAEVDALLDSFSAEHVALYFFLRVYAAEAGGNPDESLAAELLERRTDVDGLRGSLTSLADVDQVWRRDFPREVDWRVLATEPRHGDLAEISDASRRVRGEHMARALVDLVRRGERVFAVVGSGHVIRQEWNLRALLNQPPAFDQPADT